MDCDLITAAEAGSLLNVPTATVRKMVDAGDFPGTWDATSGECCIPRAAVLRLKKQLIAGKMQGASKMAGDLPQSKDRPKQQEH